MPLEQDSMDYSGKTARDTQDTISKYLEEAKQAYEDAFKAWADVQSYFTLGSEENTTDLFGGIESVSRKELDKTGDELLKLAQGINNIDDSYKELNTNITNVLKQYGKNPSDGSNNT